MPIAVESLVKTSLNLHPVSNVNRGGQIGVSGSLIDGSQNPISGALIRFTGSGSHSLDGVTTGDDGSFLHRRNSSDEVRHMVGPRPLRWEHEICSIRQ